MRLTWAEGSHHYRVDAEGNVYVPMHCIVKDAPYNENTSTQMHVRPGERPRLGRHQQWAGGRGVVTFWVRHGTREELNIEQRVELGLEEGSDMDHEDLFTNRPPTPEQAAVLDEITERMNAMHTFLLDSLPNSRFRSLAVTKLEECSMWAKKATVFTVGE